MGPVFVPEMNPSQPYGKRPHSPSDTKEESGNPTGAEERPAGLRLTWSDVAIVVVDPDSHLCMCIGALVRPSWAARSICTKEGGGRSPRHFGKKPDFSNRASHKKRLLKIANHCKPAAGRFSSRKCFGPEGTIFALGRNTAAKVHARKIPRRFIREVSKKCIGFSGIVGFCRVW